MDEYIGIFQIGPVQEYINNAKRTQDFWSGSYILSYLAAVALATVDDRMPAKIVYPFFEDDPLVAAVSKHPDNPREHDSSSIKERIGTLPNRLVAVHSDRQAITAAFNLAGVNINRAYMEIVRQVRERLAAEPVLFNYPFDRNQWEDIFKRQNETHFNTLWIVYDCPKDSQCYGEHYRLAERLFGARKGVRNFKQTKGENGKKCTLCGEREALNNVKWQAFADNGPSKKGKLYPQIRYALRKNERLCSTCIIKRLAPEIYFDAKIKNSPDALADHEAPLAFPSTGSVAVSPALHKLAMHWDNLDVQKNATDFRHHLKTLNLMGLARNSAPLPIIKTCLARKTKNGQHLFQLDGNAFIQDTFQKGILEKEYGAANLSAQLIKNCRDSLKTLLKCCNPSKYYAVIMMDGDDMGKHLGSCQLREEHKDLSKRMNSFSKTIVPQIAQSRFTGKIVYFGGDEGVIFVGLDDLFPLMRCLRAAFSGHITFNQDACHVDLMGMGANLVTVDATQKACLTVGQDKTASIGAVIAHHQQSMLQVTATLHQCLDKKAKKVDGKDAFCIAMMKRSGGTTFTTGQWVYPASHPEKQGVDVMAHLVEMVQLYRHKKLTGAWLYDLEREKHALGTSEAVYSEIERLLRRHSTIQTDEFGVTIEPRIRELIVLIDNMEKIIKGGKVDKPELSVLDNFIQLEFTAHYIAKGGGN